MRVLLCVHAFLKRPDFGPRDLFNAAIIVVTTWKLELDFSTQEEENICEPQTDEYIATQIRQKMQWFFNWGDLNYNLIYKLMEKADTLHIWSSARLQYQNALLINSDIFALNRFCVTQQ